MSTYLYLACLEHTPVLESSGEVNQHISLEIVEEIKRWLSDRDILVKALEEDAEFAGYRGTAVWFFRSHPKCRIALQTEYGDWVDLGMGLPPDVKVWEPPKPREPEPPKPREPEPPKPKLIAKFNPDVMKELEEIRERDKNAVPRLFGPNWQDNTLLQAEKDRRYLLSLLKE